MTDKEFEDLIVKVIGAVVHQPEVNSLSGSGKVFAFRSSDGPVEWYLDFRGGAMFSLGEPDSFNVRAAMSKEDWLETLKGNLSPTQAMLRRKLGVEGSVAAIASLSMEALVRSYKEQVGNDVA